MITIDQDELCEYCGCDRSRCEGSDCDDTRKNYIDDNGLVEDVPQVFGDLRKGDNIYIIYKEVLSSEKVTSILENSDGFHVEPESFSRELLNADLSVNVTKTWFVSKPAAVKEYTEIFNEKMKKMMKNIIDFEK